ncbi:MAG: hypothetical protein ACOVP7_01630 [Lacibacter sp.]
MRKINTSTIIVLTLFFLFLTVLSFFAAWAEDEGTLGNSLIWLIGAKLFYILRFPAHTLLWDVFSNGGLFVFMLGLLINCLFYALFFERVIFILKTYFRRQK